jgi:hypothetical protein
LICAPCILQDLSYNLLNKTNKNKTAMKKLFTLSLMLMTLLSANAQLSISKTNIDKNEFPGIHGKYKVTSLPKKHAQPSGRTAVTSIMLDNVGFDRAYSDTIQADFYYDPSLEINKNYGPADNLTHDYAVALYDSLVYLDVNNNGQPAFLPRRSSTLTLDSVDVFFIHEHDIANTIFYTIRITVFDRDSLRITGNGSLAVIRQNIRWDTVIITNSEIPLNIDNGGVLTFTGITLYPNLSFAQGKTFGVRVDFAGDTANKFKLISGFRDDCSNTCVASESAVNSATYTNSLYYINATTGSGQNISGVNSVAFTCGPPCNEWTAQNWWIYPWVTASVEFSAAITADSLKGCPGAVLTLKGHGFGTTATPVTYNWASNAGSLSTTSDQNVSLILTNSGTITLTVTDSNGDSIVTSVPVTSTGVGISITNPSPIDLTCGSTTIIGTAISGLQTGKSYTWNTGESGTTKFSIVVSTPGTYSVTVTNNAGCSATASVSAAYPGVTNTVNFTPPSPPVCKGQELTFLNTSTKKDNGWNSTWDMLGNNTDSVTTTNAVYTYAAAGSYNVKLTMDSAGCKFIYSRTVAVGACTSIEDIAFSGSITLQPNPSNGNITLTVNGIEKNLSVRVYNIIGSEVKSFGSIDITSIFTRNFDFSDLSNGTYLIKIQSGEKTAVKRFTINK